MLTRCPSCSTAFRVTPEQLKIRAGKVRCGHCNTVFNALETLEDAPALVANAVANAVPNAVPNTAPSAAPKVVGNAVGNVARDATSQTASNVPPTAAPSAEHTASSSARTPSAVLPTVASTPGIAASRTELAGKTDESLPQISTSSDIPDVKAPSSLREELQETHEPHEQQYPLGALEKPNEPEALSSPIAPSAAALVETPFSNTQPPVEIDAWEITNPQPTPSEDGFVPTTWPDGTPVQLPVTKPSRWQWLRRRSATSKLKEKNAQKAEKVQKAQTSPRAHSQNRLGFSWSVFALGMGLFCVLILFVLQAAYVFRAELALQQPAVRPILERMCGWLECDIPLPRKSELVSIEVSDLHPDTAPATTPTSTSATLQNSANLLILTATLKNRAAFVQAYPHLELTLTDVRDQPMVRRVFSPVDYLPSTNESKIGFAANAELAINLSLDATTAPATGYRLYLFYP